MDADNIERERLIHLITGAVHKYEQQSYRSWPQNPRSFLNSLAGTDTPRLKALCNILLTHYLEPPLVRLIVTTHDWQTVLTLNAHLEWLRSHPFEVQHLLNRAKELAVYPRIERHDNGWHPTLEVHLRAESLYHLHSRYKDHEDVAYMDNKDAISLVESYADHAEELFSYMNERKWQSIDEQHFAESLEQHALREGWL